MARKPAQTPAQPVATSRRTRPNRQAITFEHVARLAPRQSLVDNLVRTFGLEAVDCNGIREATSEHLAQAAEAFGAANGAVDAFSSVTGDTWKPYETPLPAAATVSRQSAAAEMAAFGG